MEQNPTPNPTPFFSDCKLFWYFFLITYSRAHYLQSLVCCFKDKSGVKILFCKHYLLNNFMRKGKDPDPYLWLMDPDPFEGPKTSGSGSPTLVKIPIFSYFSLSFFRVDSLRGEDGHWRPVLPLQYSSWKQGRTPRQVPEQLKKDSTVIILLNFLLILVFGICWLYFQTVNSKVRPVHRLIRSAL